MEANVALEEDIRRLAEQERLLVFSRFGPEEAWALGNVLREVGLAQGAPIAIDVSLRDRTLFHCAMPGSTPTTPSGSDASATPCCGCGAPPTRSGARWRCQAKRRKRRTTCRSPTTPCTAASFPLLLHGAGCIGAVTVSGLPQRDDHRLVADGLAAILKIDLSACRLSAEPA